jgi:hypothetical protein
MCGEVPPVALYACAICCNGFAAVAGFSSAAKNVTSQKNCYISFYAIVIVEFI